jgi:hypothetical protein
MVGVADMSILAGIEVLTTLVLATASTTLVGATVSTTMVGVGVIAEVNGDTMDTDNKSQMDWDGHCLGLMQH